MTATLKLINLQNPSSATPNIVLNADGSTTIASAGALSTSGNLTFTGTGNRITGDFSNGTIASRVLFQTSTTNSNTLIQAIPNGTGTVSRWIFANASDPANASEGTIGITATEYQFNSSLRGTGTYLPMTFATGGSERLRLDTSGHLGLGVTPSAWGTTYKAQQIGQAGVLAGHAGVASFTLTSNAYENSGWKAITTNPAQRIDLSSDNNATIFYRAASATAGAALSWNESARIDSSGNLLVSTASAYFQLKTGATSFNISAQAGANDFLRITANGTQRFQFNDLGAAYNSTGTWGTISDARLKENIVDATPKLNAINQLRVVNFNLKAEPKVKQIGFIAQEIEQVFPGLVENGEVDGEGGYYKAVKTTVLIPMLVKAIQELSTQQASLKAEFDAYKAAHP